jgi:electron transfer flavoprotein alpha subunit
MSDVVTVADHRRGELRPVSYELLTAGRDLADATGGELHAAVVGGDVDRFADRLDREGVDRIHTVAEGEEFNHDVTAAAVTALVDALDPGVVVMPHSANGLDYAPAVATRLSLPLVTDAVALSYDDGLTVTRERYGSKVAVTVDVTSEPAAVTIRGGEWPAADGVGGAGGAAIDPFDPGVDESSIRSTVRGFEEVGAGDVDITDADVVVSVGRGIDDAENLELVERLADALDATLAASRPVVDSGWLPKTRQVGQSGRVVTPTVYLALGISGAVQHVSGMKGADTIVAVNTDPDAPIFDVADYGVVGDLFEVVPALIERFE